MLCLTLRHKDEDARWNYNFTGPDSGLAGHMRDAYAFLWRQYPSARKLHDDPCDEIYPFAPSQILRSGDSFWKFGRRPGQMIMNVRTGGRSLPVQLISFHAGTKDLAEKSIRALPKFPEVGGFVKQFAGRWPLAAGPRRAARASTASRTVSGIRPVPSASTSVTKNGFPAVRIYSSPASKPCGRASVTTADRDRPARSTRVTWPPAERSPSTAATGVSGAAHRRGNSGPATRAPPGSGGLPTGSHPGTPHRPSAHPLAPPRWCPPSRVRPGGRRLRHTAGPRPPPGPPAGRRLRRPCPETVPAAAE
jgi:hypothetical protein